MSTHTKQEHTHDAFVAAVEVLASFAHWEIDEEIEVPNKTEIVIDGKPITIRTVEWVHPEDMHETLQLVKESFRIILYYLRHIYRKDKQSISNQKTIEGIKTIMVLVGEAAKKLDKYTAIFHKTNFQSITDLKEYKSLQTFYQKKIDKQVDQQLLGKWILALSHNLQPQDTELTLSAGEVPLSEHIFVDLDTVKKDTEYELFFLRKEDGSRFFNPRLIRNIKLVCDFGGNIGERRRIDPLIDLSNWRDRIVNKNANNIIKYIEIYTAPFYQESIKAKNNELAFGLKKALMALTLSSQERNLLEKHPNKTCTDYFHDFQIFFRNALHSREYQKLIAYPPANTDGLAHSMLDLIQGISVAIFTHLHGHLDLQPLLQTIVEQAEHVSSQENIEPESSNLALCDKLQKDNIGLTHLFKHHPNGPLMRVIEELEGGSLAFDPFIQNNIPNHLFDLIWNERKSTLIRMPSVTHQEIIDKAYIIEEFKGFLHSYGHEFENKRHLILNLQDRTSWREHFRSVSMEELQKHHDFHNQLTVVTLAIDTDFYHQIGPYLEIKHAHSFIHQFLEHIEDENSGFYTPKELRKDLISTFAPKLMNKIHHVFFSGKNVLTQEQRLDFIEIFYLFYQLKIIDLIKPDSISCTCKDGVDVGTAASVKLFAFLMMMNNETSDKDYEYLNLMLYGPALLMRERPILAERFHRMLSALKVIEHVKSENSGEFSKIIDANFSPLYNAPITTLKHQI